MPVILGTSTDSIPRLTYMVTLLPSVSCVPAAGSVEITFPDATVSLFCACASTTRFRFSSVFCASSSLIPFTSGTDTVFFALPVLITTFISVFFSTLELAFSLCSIISPAAYLSDSSLPAIEYPRFFFFNAAFASSSVIPSKLGTTTLASLVVVFRPIPPLNAPIAFPTINIITMAMIAAATTIKIFIIFFVFGSTFFLRL